MNNNDIFTKRWVKNGLLGDAFLDDAGAQRELAFSWNGATIVDDASGLEYFFPSTIGSTLFYHGSFERGEIAASIAGLLKLDAPIIFDVGANIGVHSVAFASALKTAQVHAFEPVNANVAVLRRNAERAGIADRIAVVEAAVAAQSGTVGLSQCEDAAYSTIGAEPAMVVEATYRVPATSLDDYAAQQAISRVDFIKIDVEGEELGVLDGARLLLERHAPLLMIEIGERSARTGEAIRLLTQLGYTAYTIADGIVERAGHAKRVSNYFFVPPARDYEPVTDVAIARAEADFRQTIVIRQRQRLVELSSEAEQRKAQVERLAEALAAEQRRVQLMQTQLSLNAPAATLPAANDEIVARLRGYVQELREEVERQHAAATERLALIEDMERRMRALGDQVREGREARDRLQAAAQERLEAIERQQAGLVARDAEIAAKAAIIERYEALLAGRNDGEASLREELQRAHARIAEIESLAMERLDVIRALKSERLA